jgi:hypothetical protein
MAMSRDVERGFGVLDPILHVFIGGFQLPLLTVLSRMSSGQYGDYTSLGVSPLPIFAVVTALIAVIWWRVQYTAAGPGADNAERFAIESVNKQGSLAMAKCG